MFKYQSLCLFGFLCVAQAFIDLENTDLVVKKIPTFPFSIEKTFNITIGPKDPAGLLTNSDSDTLVIQIAKPNGTDKEMAVIDFGFIDMFKNEFKGKFMEVLSWNISDDSQLLVVLNLTSLADNHVLEIYHLNVFSAPERRAMLNNLTLAKIMYSSKINLNFPSKIEILVDSVVNSSFRFHVGRRVDAVCRAYSSSTAKPFFHAVQKMKVLSKSTVKNEATLQFLVTTAIHEKNLTCQVGNVTKSVLIEVFHAPTHVKFQPMVGYLVGNGTNITCLAADGLPIPQITWTLSDGPKHAARFYKIDSNNQRLLLAENAPIGSRWKFKCKAINEIKGKIFSYTSRLSFKIIHNRLGNDTKGNLTTKYEPKRCPVSEIRKLVAIHDGEIIRLNLNYIKLRHDVSRWRRIEITQSSELSKMKRNIGLLEKRVKLQNTEIQKLKKNIDQKSKSVSPKVVPKVTGPTTNSSSVANKPLVAFRWMVSSIARLHRKKKTIESEKYRTMLFPFPIKLWLLLRSRDTITVTLYMYRYSGYHLSGEVRMTIFNARNSSISRSVVQNFRKTSGSLSLDFHFNYYDLLESKVLQYDHIVIQCAFAKRSAI